MNVSPPLRFLAIVLGGWAAFRTAVIAPPWSTPPADAAAVAPPPGSLARAAVREDEARPASVRAGTASKGRDRVPPGLAFRASPPSIPARPRPKSASPLPAHVAASPQAPGAGIEAAAAAQFPPPRLAAWPPPARGPSSGRWSLSAWAFVRRGDSTPLAPGGLLGGSQAGARLAFRLNRDRARPLALSARLSMPLRRPAAGAEAALGLDWQPARRLPVHLLAERRQAIGREGRSAFALTFYGGVSDSPIGRFRLDSYAQAGVVGARSLDLFGDGSARLSLPLGRDLRVGAGAWAAAQPGLSRLDLGPQASLRLPVAGRSVTLAADWRLRAAGNAEPGSGPTLTLSTDF